MKKIAIIGAGMSGLTLAHLLKDQVHITLFEKSRGVGGRMATRRAELFEFDHGAQYFTCRTPEFEAFIQPLKTKGVIARWDASYAKFKGNKCIEQRNWQAEAPRYVGISKMNSIGKHLAQGLSIHLGTKIKQLKRYKNKWLLIKDGEGENKDEFGDFDWVICTAPNVQMLNIMPNDISFFKDAKGIAMLPCLSLMLGFNKAFSCSFDAAHVIDSDISWIAINSQKPHRPASCSVVIHASETYSKQHIDDDENKIFAHLLSVASEMLGVDMTKASHRALQRWRYSNNLIHHQTNSIFIDSHRQLAACGDWCSGGRVEGAFISAHRLAEALIKRIAKNNFIE